MRDHGNNNVRRIRMGNTPGSLGPTGGNSTPIEEQLTHSKRRYSTHCQCVLHVFSWIEVESPTPPENLQEATWATGWSGLVSHITSNLALHANSRDYHFHLFLPSHVRAETFMASQMKRKCVKLASSLDVSFVFISPPPIYQVVGRCFCCTCHVHEFNACVFF